MRDHQCTQRQFCRRGLYLCQYGDMLMFLSSHLDQKTHTHTRRDVLKRCRMSSCPHPHAAQRPDAASANPTGHPPGSGLTHISHALTVISLFCCPAAATSTSPPPPLSPRIQQTVWLTGLRSDSPTVPSLLLHLPPMVFLSLPVCLASSHIWIAATLATQPLIVWHAGPPLWPARRC